MTTKAIGAKKKKNNLLDLINNKSLGLQRYIIDKDIIFRISKLLPSYSTTKFSTSVKMVIKFPVYIFSKMIFNYSVNMCKLNTVVQ